jgi:nucleoside-diphosphate-sugar epimerase
LRILVVGGTRFIGPYVIRELTGSGHDVAVYHRGQNETALPDSVIHFHNSKAGMPVVVFEPEVVSFRPEIVLHMIAMGEADAKAAVAAFAGIARRLVVISSGDVYRAYGVFMGSEPGEIETMPLTEGSPLREHLFPYRKMASGPNTLEYNYEKILAERAAMNAADLSGTVLRLPKVYGPGENADLGTIYRYRDHPQWRWTHGYVENVAHAIALAVTDDRAAGRIYNVGEEATPRVEERLKALPPSDLPNDERLANFEQDIVYDTSRIRRELGYHEIVSYEVGIQRTLAGVQAA